MTELRASRASKFACSAPPEVNAKPDKRRSVMARKKMRSLDEMASF